MKLHLHLFYRDLCTFDFQTSKEANNNVEILKQKEKKI